MIFECYSLGPSTILLKILPSDTMVPPQCLFLSDVSFFLCANTEIYSCHLSSFSVRARKLCTTFQSSLNFDSLSENCRFYPPGSAEVELCHNIDMKIGL